MSTDLQRPTVYAIWAAFHWVLLSRSVLRCDPTESMKGKTRYWLRALCALLLFPLVAGLLTEGTVNNYADAYNKPSYVTWSVFRIIWVMVYAVDADWRELNPALPRSSGGSSTGGRGGSPASSGVDLARNFLVSAAVIVDTVCSNSTFSTSPSWFWERIAVLAISVPTAAAWLWVLNTGR